MKPAAIEVYPRGKSRFQSRKSIAAHLKSASLVSYKFRYLAYWGHIKADSLALMLCTLRELFIIDRTVDLNNRAICSPPPQSSSSFILSNIWLILTAALLRSKCVDPSSRHFIIALCTSFRKSEKKELQVNIGNDQYMSLPTKMVYIPVPLKECKTWCAQEHVPSPAYQIWCRLFLLRSWLSFFRSRKGNFDYPFLLGVFVFATFRMRCCWRRTCCSFVQHAGTHRITSIVSMVHVR